MTAFIVSAIYSIAEGIIMFYLADVNNTAETARAAEQTAAKFDFSTVNFELDTLLNSMNLYIG